MKKDFFYDSCGAGKIHACCWMPEGEPKAIVQIVHGIAEFAERYEAFATYLNGFGYVVVAEDHMGHGQSMEQGSTQGYFHGGWFRGVEDSYRLLQDTRKEFPSLPYILFGHSMGSFMVRTILAQYPDSGISGTVICGTGWQPREALPVMIPIMVAVCKKTGEDKPNAFLHKLIFGGYNHRIPDARTPFDWLSRDTTVVDAYTAHPHCGFVPACGLLRDMVKGILYVEQPGNLKKMKKHLPVLLIAGMEDPVGPYGKGVARTEKAFRKAGMVNVTMKLYPECRHELLNELNRQEIYEDIHSWMERIFG